MLEIGARFGPECIGPDYFYSSNTLLFSIDLFRLAGQWLHQLFFLQFVVKKN